MIDQEDNCRIRIVYPVLFCSLSLTSERIVTSILI